MICFLDRDGILNIDLGHVGTLDRFIWNMDIFQLLTALKVRGYSFVLVTNQSGIGRGYYTFSDFCDLTFYILNYLHSSHGIDIEVNFCPHLPSDNCTCRKPSPGMLLRYAIGPLDIMIGDKATDMESAQQAGILHRWLVCAQASGPFTSHFRDLRSLMLSLNSLI